jgi:tetratricopeptide (TPR) repeat protein
MAAIEDVLAIPGNPHVLERLRALLGSGRAAGFVGAGASAGLYPLWNALVGELADQAVARGLASDADRAVWLSTAAHNPQQAVRGIKQQLGAQTTGAILRATFGYRKGPDGNRYTPVHAGLLGLPLRGYVTTNYDPGLLEARRVLRPEVVATGYATWRDDGLREWLTGEVFEDPQGCPVLYAHGIFERSDTIVLGAGEYREAYQPGHLLQRVVDKLWAQERLVFVGFGFSDAWFDVVAEQVLGVLATHAGEPRHVAVVSLPYPADSSASGAYSPEIRRKFRDAYDAEVLLYPVPVTEQDGTRHEDHQLLQVVLDALAGTAPDRPTVVEDPATTVAKPADSPSDRRTATAPPRSLVQRWVHDTSEDDRYVEPADALARLDRWAADPQVRAIAVTGIGGLGKTALLGHWLKHRGGTTRRQVAGLLVWSCNTDRDPTHFRDALISFAARDLHLPLPAAERAAAAEVAAATLAAAPLLVVLDGLEVWQEPPGDPRGEESGRLDYGEFLHDDLRELLDAACRADQPGLVLLTSRFPFTDLTGHLGSSLRLLELERLTPRQGADLLDRLGVGGTEEAREEVADHFFGHPLALRAFAATLARQPHGDPTQALAEISHASPHSRQAPASGGDGGLEDRLAGLLDFYQTQLPPAWQALLGIVALFADQVPLTTVLQFARELPAVQQHLKALSDGQIRQGLTQLVGDGLLTRERDPTGQEGFACHPVVRDHFRTLLLARDPASATTAAGLLTGQAGGQVEDLTELRVVTTAIGLLLDADQTAQASDLYRERLADGRVFGWLVAPREGLACSLAFVATAARRDQLQQALSIVRLDFFLNAVGISARQAGELDLAERYYREDLDLSRQLDDPSGLSITLQNRVDLLVDLGRLADAEPDAREAIAMARQAGDEAQECGSLAYLGRVLGLQGQIAEALAAFDDADQIERRINPPGVSLYSTRGVWWAELLLRLGQTGRAGELTEANLPICQQYGWQNDVARCQWVLGRLASLAGDHTAGAEQLADAAAIMRRGHRLVDLVPVLLAQADLERRRRAWPGAHGRVEEALGLAGPRRLRLHHADALILRGRIRLDHARSDPAADQLVAAEQALDDATFAARLARECGYLWGERDAEQLLSDAHVGLDDQERAHQHRREAQALTSRLGLPPKQS